LSLYDLTLSLNSKLKFKRSVLACEHVPVDVEPDAIDLGEKTALCEGCVFIAVLEVRDKDHCSAVWEFFGIEHLEPLKLGIHRKFKNLLFPEIEVLGNGRVARVGCANDIIDVIEGIGAVARAHQGLSGFSNFALMVERTALQIRFPTPARALKVCVFCHLDPLFKPYRIGQIRV
jgi:hypothetical protein